MPKKNKPTIALIYDFDGTLSPGNMQEFGFIRAINKNAEAFWAENKALSQSQDASEILCYMRLMIKQANANNISLKRESFQSFGKDIKLYPGVEAWFDMIDAYGQDKGVVIEHYINSSGIKEMIEGTAIARKFKRIYACSFLYDVDGRAEWPAVAVDYTTKTQFLFKISKGIDSVSDNTRINEYLPEDKRPVPFKHMIYFGDGTTDIPCMRLVKEQGGHAIAVYGAPDKQEVAERLITQHRVNFACLANYTRNKEMHKVVTRIIDKITADIEFEKLMQEHKQLKR